MSLLSIRLNNQLVNETKERAKDLKMSETKYIRIAIEHMNQEVLLKKSKKNLEQASLKVRKESLLINDEFSKVEHDPKP
jgi:hypothetical protein